MTEAPMMFTALGGVNQAFSSYQAGQANKSIARFNATNDRMQAEQAMQAGSTEQARAATKEQILKGAQTSAFAGQGVVTGAGTARTVVAASEAASEMDRLMIGINARRQAYGYRVRAADEMFAGREAAIQGNEAALGSLMRVGGQALIKHQENTIPGTESRQSLLSDEGSTDISHQKNYGSNMEFT
jgi:hypothetical protein